MNDKDLQTVLMSSEIMKNVVESVKTAAGEGFMSREHAAAVWKQVLRVSGFDVVRKLPEKS